MTEPIYNPAMRLRTSIVAALVLFCTACTEPAVPRYVIPTPTSPSPIPAPTPAPVPTPTGSILNVSLQVGPISPIAGLSAALTAVTTTVNKQPSTYVWTFGDGAVDTSTSSTPFFVSTFHTFGRSGIYDARVDLTDGDGRTASAFAHFTVQAAPPPPAPPPDTPAPVASPTMTVTVAASPAGGTLAPATPITFTATPTLTNGAGAVVSYDWDLDGDATYELTTITNTTTKTYTVSKTYTAKVRANSATVGLTATAQVIVGIAP